MSKEIRTNMVMEETAKAIGGAVTRAYHITNEKTNRVLVEAKKFEDVAMSSADGYENKYSDLLEIAEKFVYITKVLTENNSSSALDGLQDGICWLREHKSERVDKSFFGCYMYGFSCDIYKH